MITLAVASALALSVSLIAQGAASATPLFDGQSFIGWEGETNQTWRIEQGAIVGGSLQNKVPRNEFLVTHRSFTNFVLHATFRLQGTNGFINGGIQFRSERLNHPPNEMRGYQADIGEGYWGAIYDESRRNKILAAPAPDKVAAVVRLGDWNRYTIRCEGRRIRTYLNDQLMVDYTETDPAIPQHGRIGLQIHGDGCAEIRFKNVTIESL